MADSTEPTGDHATGQNKRPSRRQMLQQTAAVAAALGVGGFLTVTGPPAPKRTKRLPVRFWHEWTAEWQIVVEKIVARFNESQSRYEVIPLSIPSGSADSKFLLAAVGGDPPDMMAQYNLVLPTWAEHGLLLPLDTLMSSSEKRLFQSALYSFVQKVGAFRGHLYGFGMGANLNVCFYRPNHFREAGLDPDRFPTTLEELTAVGEKLHTFDRAGNLTRIGFLPQQFNQFAALYGGGFYDEKTGQVTLNTRPNLRALTYISAQNSKLGYNNVLRFTSGLTGDTGGSSDWPFISGAYSIVLDGQWRMEQLSKFAPQLEYRTAPLPAPIGGVSNAASATADMLLIPREAKQPEGAWEFIKFWSGMEHPERAAEFYIWGGWLPTQNAIAYAPIYQAYLKKYPALQTFLSLLPSKNIQPPPPVAYQSYLFDRINRTQDLVVRGTMGPQAALKQLEADIVIERTRRKELGYAD